MLTNVTVPKTGKSSFHINLIGWLSVCDRIATLKLFDRCAYASPSSKWISPDVPQSPTLSTSDSNELFSKAFFFLLHETKNIQYILQNTIWDSVFFLMHLNRFDIQFYFCRHLLIANKVITRKRNLHESLRNKRRKKKRQNCYQWIESSPVDSQIYFKLPRWLYCGPIILLHFKHRTIQCAFDSNEHKN